MSSIVNPSWPNPCEHDCVYPPCLTELMTRRVSSCKNSTSTNSVIHTRKEKIGVKVMIMMITILTLFIVRTATWPMSREYYIERQYLIVQSKLFIIEVYLTVTKYNFFFFALTKRQFLVSSPTSNHFDSKTKRIVNRMALEIVFYWNTVKSP